MLQYYGRLFYRKLIKIHWIFIDSTTVEHFKPVKLIKKKNIPEFIHLYNMPNINTITERIVKIVICEKKNVDSVYCLLK